MNLRRRQVCGRDRPHAECVPRGAIGQTVEADAGAGLRQIVVTQVIAQARVSRQQLQADQSAIGRRDPLSVGVAETRWQMGDWLPEQALLGSRNGQCIELRDGLGHQYRRLHAAFCKALAHVGDGLIEQDRNLRSALRPVVVVRYVFERLRAGAGTELHEGAGDVVELVDRNQPVGKTLAFEIAFEVAAEYLGAEAVLFTESRRIDGLDPRQPFLVEGMFPRPVFGSRSL